MEKNVLAISRAPSGIALAGQELEKFRLELSPGCIAECERLERARRAAMARASTILVD